MSNNTKQSSTMWTKKKIIGLILAVTVATLVQKIVSEVIVHYKTPKSVDELIEKEKAKARIDLQMSSQIEQAFTEMEIQLSPPEKDKLAEICETICAGYDPTPFFKASFQSAAKQLDMDESEFLKKVTRASKQEKPKIESALRNASLRIAAQDTALVQIGMNATQTFFNWWVSQHPEYKELIPTNLNPQNDDEAKELLIVLLRRDFVTSTVDEVIEEYMQENKLPLYERDSARQSLIRYYKERLYPKESVSGLVDKILASTPLSALQLVKTLLTDESFLETPEVEKIVLDWAEGVSARDRNLEFIDTMISLQPKTDSAKR